MEQRSYHNNGFGPVESQGGKYRSVTRRLVTLAITGAMVTCPAQALADELASVQQPQETAAASTTENAAATDTTATDAAATDTAADTPATDETAATTEDDSTEASTAQPAAQAGAAQSSDTSTYEEAGLYQVRVDYVGPDGQKVAASYVAALKEGQSFSVASPSLDGYVLADDAQATISGTATGSGHDLTYTVRYNTNVANYTVVYEMQTEGDYHIQHTETYEGVVGSVATAQPEAIVGYHCVTTGSGLSTVVAADGTSTITLRYDLDVSGYGIYYVTNGTYVPAQTGKTGDAVVKPADPTRAGYTFAGWDTDGDGIADALPETIGNTNVTATAVWTPAETTYQVRYWIESEKNPGTYTLAETRTLAGITGQQTTYEDLDTSLTKTNGTYGTYASFTPAGTAESKTIAGDGSTTVDVYYNFKTAQVQYYEFTIGDSEAHPYGDPVTVKLNVLFALPTDEATAAHTARVGEGQSFVTWLNYNSNLLLRDKTAVTLFNNPTIAEDGTISFRLIAEFTNRDMVHHYYFREFQDIDDDNYTIESTQDRTTVNATGHWNFVKNHEGLHAVAYAFSTNVWDGKDQADIQLGDWHYFTDDEYSNGNYKTDTETYSQFNVVVARYDRDICQVTYYSMGDKVASYDYRYGASGSTSDVAPTNGPAGMVFAGWYGNADFTGERVTDFTVPAGGLNLYALWKHPDVRVTFEEDGGSEVADETVAWEQHATEPETPTRDGYEFGGWYYYGTSGIPARFSFDMPLENDVTLYASWRSVQQPTTYTVVHKAADGTVLATQTLEGTVGETVFATPLDANARGIWHYADAAGRGLLLSSDADANVITFTYSADATHEYVIRFVDAATGEEIAQAVHITDDAALLDYLAPEVAGYQVRNGGKGYLMASADGTATELVFLYDKVSVPADTTTGSPIKTASVRTTPTAEAKASSDELPNTGDTGSASGAASLGILGTLAAAFGIGLRRRDASHEE